MNQVNKVLCTWILLRLLWGPWNLLLGIKWSLTDDMAEDVVLMHGLLGGLGTIVLVLGLGGFVYQLNQAVVGHTAYQWLLAWSILYVVCAVLLKIILVGRRQHVFSLP